MNKILRILMMAALVASFSALTSCGGGSGSADSTTISGVVSDDPIAGATVTATSVDTGEVLGSATTAADGSYSLNITTSQIGSGYILNSSGGTMNGQIFDGNLSAIYPATANARLVNLTLITTALVEAAKTTTQYRGTILQKHEALKTIAIKFGVLNPDYFLVEPSGTLMAALRIKVQRLGIILAISKQAQLLDATPTIGGCGVTDTTCGVVVNFKKDFSLTFQGTTISLPAYTFSNNKCLVYETLNASSQTVTMLLVSIFGKCAIGTTGNKFTFTSTITSDQAAGGCLAPDKRATSIPNCIFPIDSGITPSYFFDDGTYSHRSDLNIHSFIPSVGTQVELSYNYGAVLNASAAPIPETAIQNQWKDKNAVIFVHGYAPGESFGGDDGTWGMLPKLVLDDPSFVALNFQWITDASYLSVADNLAKAVDYAYRSTGKKVHIVAHSFGGVLSRTMLQNLRGDSATSASYVATLTTVGTPHSGISEKAQTVDNVTLPRGWGAILTLPSGSVVKPSGIFCGGEISCYQSGLLYDIGDWAKAELTPCMGDGVIDPGYINACLAKKSTPTTYNYPFQPGLKVRVLIGQIIDNNTGTLLDGDFLISYRGQRFVPSTVLHPLLSDELRGRATISERVLDLPGFNAYPGDSNFGDISNTYMYMNSAGDYIGYKHTTFIYHSIEANKSPVTKEVYVPSDCNNAATCQHDTWLNINEFLHSNIAPSVSIDNLKDTGITAANAIR